MSTSIVSLNGLPHASQTSNYSTSTTNAPSITQNMGRMSPFRPQDSLPSPLPMAAIKPTASAITTIAMTGTNPVPLLSLLGIASATPLALLATAVCLFVTGMYNLRVGQSVHSPGNYMLGVTVCYGGIGQAITGILEFLAGSSIRGTLFTTLGMYWLSYGALSLPGFGIAPTATILEGSQTIMTLDPDYVAQLAIISLSWTIVASLLWTLTWRTNLINIILFFLVALIQWLETVALFTRAESGSELRKVEGALMVLGALFAWYFAMALLCQKSLGSVYELPLGELPLKDEEEGLLSRPGK